MVALRALQPEMQVIIATRDATFEVAVRAMKLGAFHCVAKPVDGATLADLISRAVAQAGAARIEAEAGRALLDSAGRAGLHFRTVAAVRRLLVADAVHVGADCVRGGAAALLRRDARSVGRGAVPACDRGGRGAGLAFAAGGGPARAGGAGRGPRPPHPDGRRRQSETVLNPSSR
jgi:hypothetical protein